MRAWILSEAYYLHTCLTRLTDRSGLRQGATPVDTAAEPVAQAGKERDRIV